MSAGRSGLSELRPRRAALGCAALGCAALGCAALG
ncbi:hypothetical protein BJ973_002156 [Actinoplanes tereljensis]